MKHGKSRQILSLLALGLSIVGTTRAVDLLSNGSFEATGSWPYFGSLQYGDPLYAGPPVPSIENPGVLYSWRLATTNRAWEQFTTPTNEADHLQYNLAFAAAQTVALTNALPEADLDSGVGRFTLSSWLASYNSEPEQPYVVLRFYNDAATIQLGGNVIFDRATNTYAISYASGYPANPPPADLASDHNWIKYRATGVIPSGARRARIYLTRSPRTGLFLTPDTYMDLIKLDVVTTNLPGPPVIANGPVSQTAALGNSPVFSVEAQGAGSLSYQWRHEGTNLPGGSGSSLVLPGVQASAAGAYDVVVTNANGSATSSPPAILTLVNPAVFVTGEWDFDQGLAASYGADLEYYDAGTQTNTSFGTTTSFGIPDINGQPTTVMKITPTSGNSGHPGANPGTTAWGGFKLFHGIAPNGGGAFVNQYTLICDLFYPASADNSWRAVLRAATTAATGGPDAEFYVNPANALGSAPSFDGNISAGNWHRIALAVDLAGPGPHPVVAKFVDGAKVGEQTNLSGVDGRFSLPPSFALLFADNNGYNNDAYVSSVQISSGRRPDAFIAALGGPSALKIPGAILATEENGATIHWTGGVPLESADSVSGPWTIVPGLSPGQSSYSPPSLETEKFYRPKIP